MNNKKKQMKMKVFKAASILTGDGFTVRFYEDRKYGVISILKTEFPKNIIYGSYLRKLSNPSNFVGLNITNTHYMFHYSLY